MEKHETERELEGLRERYALLTASVLRISSSLEFNSILQEVVNSACALVNARCGVVITIDEAGAPPGFCFTGFTEEEERRFHGWRPEDGLRVIGHLDDIGGALRTEDWPGYLCSLGFEPDLVVGTNVICAPIEYESGRLGYFFIADRRDGSAFSDDCERTARLFASLAANAIRNARMHDSERRLRIDFQALLDAAPTGLIVFRAQGSNAPSIINPEARRLLSDLMDPEESEEEFLRAARARPVGGGVEVKRDNILMGESFWTEEVEVSRSDGRSVRVLSNAVPVRGEGGEIVSAVVTLQDLEPVRQAERQQTDFISMVSHELRAPLAAVRGSAAAALDDGDRLDRSGMLGFLRTIHEQAGGALRLVGDLVDMGQIRSGALSVVPERSDIGDIVERARLLFADGEGCAVRIRLAAGLPPVMADPGRIAQVLANLLSNAARHAPEGSIVEVGAEAHENGEVAIWVRDEGEGLSPERAQALFRKYAKTTDALVRDAGLGLSICKGLVEAHGGRIWAESAGFGRGAVFTFTVPVAETAEDTAEAEDAAGRSAPARILVVDDDPHMLRRVRDILRKGGFVPVVTGDHKDLPHLLRMEKPELVLLDLMLPGANGIELLKRLPGLAGVPVVIVSVYDGGETIAQALDAGAEDYFVKPFSENELMARVRSVLRRRARSGAFTLGELTVDYETRRVSVGGRGVELTATEYEILSLLARNAGRTVTHDELLRGTSGRPRFGGRNPLSMHVSALRRKLGDSAGKPVWVLSERGVGYRRPGGGSCDRDGKPVESLAETAGSRSDGNTHLPL